jgi:hypothetical protein
MNIERITGRNQEIKNKVSIPSLFFPENIKCYYYKKITDEIYSLVNLLVIFKL